MSYLPLIVIAVVLLVLLAFSRRTKRRSAELDLRMRHDIGPGAQVMTTSGLYGTVVAVNSDDTVILAIAPGVEVRWAFAALRDASALPPRYRRTPMDGSSAGSIADQTHRSDLSDDS